MTSSLKKPLLPEPQTEASEDARKLRKAIMVSIALMMIEIVGGYLANSLAIITDAMHLLSDVGGFALSLLALHFMSMKATTSYSFGFHQAGALGGLMSVLIVWLMAGGLLVQATYRLLNPVPVDGKLMSVVATFAFLANVILMLVLGHHHHGGGECSHSGHGHSHGADHGHAHGNDSHGGHGGHGGHAGHEGHAAHEGHSGHEGHGGHGGHAGHEAHGGHGGHAAHDAHSHGPGAACCDDHGKGGHEGHQVVAVGDEEAEDEKAREKQASIVMQAAVIHVIGDMVQSIGVMLAGFLIWLKPFDVGTTPEGVSNWMYADPIITLIFSVLVIFTTISTIRNATKQMLLSVPDNINPKAVKHSLCSVEHVVSVHDLHCWMVGQTSFCTGHVVVDDLQASMTVLEKCIMVAQKKHGLGHVTFQIEVQGQFNHSIEHLRLGDESCHDDSCCA